MNLSEKLRQDMKDALKNKDKTRLSTLRFLLSQLKNREIEKRSPLVDEDIIEVIQKGIKQRKEVLPSFERVFRQDLIEQANKEMEILQSYLPAQMSEEELKKIIDEAIKETGATTLKDMGKIMGTLMPRVKGRADGKVVNELIRGRLQSSI